MELLNIKTVKVSKNLLKKLEELKLIKRFVPPERVYNAKPSSGTVSVSYTSSEKFGSHKLICVGKKQTKIKLSFHEDNEDIMLINQTSKKFKPLYFIIGLSKQKVLEQKAEKNNLTKKDFLAIEMEYNNFETSIFTVLKGTLHCEVTVEGAKQYPVFYVTEGSKLKMNYPLLNKKYKFKIS